MTLHSTSFVPLSVSQGNESRRHSGSACVRRRPRGLSVAQTCIQRAIAVLVESIARGRATTVRRCAVTLLGSGCLMASMAPAAAATFDVSNETQLRTALATAASGDTIRFLDNITVTTAGGGDLPAVMTDLTIEGRNNVTGGNFTLSGNNQNRGLFVYAGTVAVNVAVNLTIANTLARGGNGGVGGGGAGLGGALFVREGANVTISNVAIQASRAVGGSTSSTAAGGGGLGGSGGGNFSAAAALETRPEVVALAVRWARNRHRRCVWWCRRRRGLVVARWGRRCRW